MLMFSLSSRRRRFLPVSQLARRKSHTISLVMLEIHGNGLSFGERLVPLGCSATVQVDWEDMGEVCLVTVDGRPILGNTGKALALYRN